jgi:SAM-dependent methyltransferase
MSARARFRDDVGSFGFLDDPAGRALRGRRVVAVLRRFHREDLAPLALLDVGCSAGLVTAEVARHVRFAVGVDPDPVAVAYATRNVAQSGRLAFACCAGEALPFADETFDVVMCGHVYEHARDAPAMMREIARVLRPDGVCWFAGGHTFQLVEPHYRLPLLSMLPRTLASRIVRASGRGEDYAIRFLSPWRLRRLLEAFGEASFVTPELLADPVRYELGGALRRAPVRHAVRALARPLAYAAPTWHWLLRRPRRGG